MYGLPPFDETKHLNRRLEYWISRSQRHLREAWQARAISACKPFFERSGLFQSGKPKVSLQSRQGGIAFSWTHLVPASRYPWASIVKVGITWYHCMVVHPQTVPTRCDRRFDQHSTADVLATWQIRAMASNLLATASNLLATASNLIAMASNLEYMKMS